MTPPTPQECDDLDLRQYNCSEAVLNVREAVLNGLGFEHISVDGHVRGEFQVMKFIVEFLNMDL